LKTAEVEMQQLSNFDYIVLNPCNDIDSAIENILAIVKAEKCRVNPRQINL